MPQSVGYASGTSGRPSVSSRSSRSRTRAGTTARDQASVSSARRSSIRSTGSGVGATDSAPPQAVQAASTRSTAAAYVAQPSHAPPAAPAPQTRQRPATRAWCRRAPAARADRPRHLAHLHRPAAGEQLVEQPGHPGPVVPVLGRVEEQVVLDAGERERRPDPGAVVGHHLGRRAALLLGRGDHVVLVHVEAADREHRLAAGAGRAHRDVAGHVRPGQVTEVQRPVRSGRRRYQHGDRHCSLARL